MSATLQHQTTTLQAELSSLAAELMAIERYNFTVSSVKSTVPFQGEVSRRMLCLRGQGNEMSCQVGDSTSCPPSMLIFVKSSA